jgi:N-methylhydantoinase A/acetone carboxylase beta subunit
MWNPQLCYTDAGGTFTDAFVVNEEGDFILGKPEDVSIGYFDSIDDTIKKIGISREELFVSLNVNGYGATTVINTLLERKGTKLGLLITKGFGGYLLMERGGQTFSGYTLPDRLHPVTHIHNEPLIPKDRIRGVTERIDMFGVVAIPLYGKEVEKAAQELLEVDIEGLAICFLYSFQNSGHEIKALEIAKKVMKNCGKEVPIYLSSEVNPVLREFPRLNSTIIEAYAGAPSSCDPEWMVLRKFYCPGCQAQLDVEAVPPGYPFIFDFQPDLEAIKKTVEGG